MAAPSCTVYWEFVYPVTWQNVSGRYRLQPVNIIFPFPRSYVYMNRIIFNCWGVFRQRRRRPLTIPSPHNNFSEVAVWEETSLGDFGRRHNPVLGKNGTQCRNNINHNHKQSVNTSGKNVTITKTYRTLKHILLLIFKH